MAAPVGVAQCRMSRRRTLQEGSLCALSEGTCSRLPLLPLFCESLRAGAPPLSVSSCSAQPACAGCAGGEPGLAASYK